MSAPQVNFVALNMHWPDLKETTEYIFTNHLGDWASIAGVLIGLVGFALTLYNLRKTKSIAQTTAAATENLRQDLRRVNTIEQVSTAIAAMEEIKRHQRGRNWNILPERYSALRKELVTIRATNPNMREDHQTAIQGAIQFLKGIESQVDKWLTLNQTSPDIARINKIVSDQVDSLLRVLNEIKEQTGK